MKRHLDIGLAASAALLLAACQPPPGEATGEGVPSASASGPEEVGAVSLQLTLASQYQFHSVHYDISGVGFQRAADVNVDNSAAFATVVGGIPFGHYTATLTTQDAVGKLTPCTGSTAFDITSAPVLPVTVRLTCREVVAPVPMVPIPRGAALVLGVLIVALGAWRLRGARTLVVAIGLATGAIGMSACDAGPTPPQAEVEAEGSARMALDVAPGIALDTIAYLINGPGTFTKTGTIDVSQSATLSASIAPLPPGSAFTINMNATGRGGGSMCVGSASFAIMAHQTTMVLVHMLCREASNVGTVSFQGAPNVCPLIDNLGASPGEVMVGGSIALSVLAHDSDAKPSPLAYQWTASGGTLANPTTQNAQLTCIAVGPVTVTLVASDGDNTPGCPDSQSMVVTCTPAGAP